MGILIPKRFENHLRKDDKWHTCVTMLKGRVEQFLSVSPEFFPDYTGHGIDHINEVLTAADKLIVEDAFRESEEKDADSGILEPMDVAYLVCAILVHDLGMFLHQDGVRKLTGGPLCTRKITGSGDVPWRKVWQEYTDRTRQYSAERMHRHFGKLMTISGSSADKETMDDDDKRIIGEFLRQNHGRLAHEIVLYGMPGSEDIDLFRSTDLSESERDMIGMLARSHTMSIRDTENYLKSQFEEGPMPDNTPVFFLMSVLRIADLLDAGDHRAPVLMMEHQNIHVPISEEEWAWNQRITKSKCRWNLKQKNRHIYAEPRSSVEYVQLDKWLKWVQAELDLCWSILAEQYPNGYRLSIHRVTSRIYQTAYRKTMNEKFVTREVKVTANPEVTRLLIAPLYGNDPSYGIRELLQNAVDACVEREYKEDDSYKGLVTIRIDPWTDPETGKNLGVFTIEDNGIGMNEHVLLNYYLSAGASYRSSDEWKQEYTEGGKSQVARTGKFGVGFLAAFLLGDSISVVTQHANDELGYSFTYTNQPKPLNITRKLREQGAGTTITIRLKEGVWEKLKKGEGYPWFNWYAFDDPEVRYFFEGKQVSSEILSLSRNPGRNPDWFRLDTHHYAAYLWYPNYKGMFLPTNHDFFCNGIRIQNLQVNNRYGKRNLFSFFRYGLDFPCPHISLIDYDERLGMDLPRANIAFFPEKDHLAKQMILYHLARLLLYGGSQATKTYINTYVFPLRYLEELPFLFTNRGFQINNATVLSILQPEQIVLLYHRGEKCNSIIDAARQFIPDELPFGLCFDRPYSNAIRDIFERNHLGLDSYSNGYYASEHCRNIWVRYGFSDEADLCEEIRGVPCEIPVDYMEQYLPCSVDDDDEPIATPINWEHYDRDRFPAVFQILNPNKDGDTLFAKVLRDVLEPAPGYDRNDIWIPFDMEERKKKFPKAFRELEMYMDAIKKDPEAHHVNL